MLSGRRATNWGRAGLERVCGAVWAYLGGFWPGFFNRSPWYAQLEASEFKHRPWWPKRAPFEFAPVCRKRGGWSDELPPVLAALQVTTHDRQVRALLALLGQLRQVNLQCRGGGGGRVGLCVEEDCASDYGQGKRSKGDA